MEITVSTGVIFKIKKAPAMAFQAVVKQWDKAAPKAPVTYIESKDRNEENPSDPDYIQAKRDYEERRNTALFDAAILFCTEIESVPEGINKPEDDDWLEDLKILGIAPGAGKRERYLSWVKYYAAPDDTDLVSLNVAISRVNGVSEGDVSAAMAAFKSAQRGRIDTELSPERAD